MRLAQLARKASVKTSEIVHFLSSKEITVEDNANTKIDEEQVQLILAHFAPHLLELTIAPLEEPKEIFTVELEPTQVLEIVEVNVIDESASIPATVTEEIIETLPEVIRVPKIELSGLKVLGKIELPEKVKAAKPVTIDSEASEIVNSKLGKRSERTRAERQTSRPRPAKNSIAVVREQEQQLEDEKRKLALEQRKEIRKQNYIKKRVNNSPPKRAKSEDKPASVIVKRKVYEKRTLWDRFTAWLFSRA